MANRQLLTRRHIVFGLAWGSFVFAYLVILALPEKLDYPFALLALAVLAIVTSIFCAAMLVVIYHQFFAQWRGTALIAVVLALGRWLTTHPALPSRVEFAVLVLTIDAMSVLGISVVMVLWRRDAGLPLIGWLSAIFVWIMLISNRVQGNTVELYLRSISNTTDYPLWWLDSLFCILWWTIPIGTLSFLLHTMKLIRKEIQGT